MTLKGGYETTDPRLDRIPSATQEHLVKYPITLATLPSSPSSMLLAMNWYENFSTPIRTRIRGVDRYIIGRGNLGNILGGHAVCGRNWFINDAASWWEFYDQGVEGRCVEFASLRMLSHLNRKRYDITSRWVYHTAQELDEWPGCYLGHNGYAYEGTSGRAGLEVLRAYGAIPALPKGAPISFDAAPNLVDAAEGIAAYRWAMDWQQVRTALNVPDYLPGIPINNSWGRYYPREVILLDEAGERVLREDGEFGIITDK